MDTLTNAKAVVGKVVSIYIDPLTDDDEGVDGEGEIVWIEGRWKPDKNKTQETECYFLYIGYDPNEKKLSKYEVVACGFTASNRWIILPVFHQASRMNLNSTEKKKKKVKAPVVKTEKAAVQRAVPSAGPKPDMTDAATWKRAFDDGTLQAE